MSITTAECPVSVGQRVRSPGRAQNEIQMVLGSERGTVEAVYQNFTEGTDSDGRTYKLLYPGRWVAIVRFDNEPEIDGTLCWADELEKIDG